jgi:long-chain-fatty-acid--CoA ligase ACSBG
MAQPDMGEEHVKEIQQKNEAAIDHQGWLHSGDKGCLSAEGMFRITGRYKELIIGAGGENIAPVPIEDEIKRLCPIISNFIMIGDKRKFNAALVTLQAEGATGVQPGTNVLAGAAAALDATITTIEQAAAEGSPHVKAIAEAIKATNKNPNVVPNNASTIQKFSILPHDISVDTDELTPTYKLKRNVIDEKYKPAIDAIYEDKREYVPFQGGGGGGGGGAEGGGGAKSE